MPAPSGIQPQIAIDSKYQSFGACRDDMVAIAYSIVLMQIQSLTLVSHRELQANMGQSNLILRAHVSCKV